MTEVKTIRKAAANIKRGDDFEILNDGNPIIVTALEDAYLTKERTDSTEEFVEIPLKQGGYFGFPLASMVEVFKGRTARAPGPS